MPLAANPVDLDLPPQGVYHQEKLLYDWLARTGLTQDEIRSEFLVHLAHAAANDSGCFSGVAVLEPSEIIEDGVVMLNTDPYYPFRPPAGYRDADDEDFPDGSSLVGSRTFKKREAAFVCYPVTIADLRVFFTHDYEDTHRARVFLSEDEDDTLFAGQVTHDPECWVVTVDHPVFPSLVARLCEWFDIELIENTETIEQHRPYMLDLVDQIKASRLS